MGQDKILEATNKAGESVSFQYLQGNESISMMRMYPSPDVNIKVQVKYMHEKATTWEISIRAGGVQWNKVWISLN